MFAGLLGVGLLCAAIAAPLLTSHWLGLEAVIGVAAAFAAFLFLRERSSRLALRRALRDAHDRYVEIYDKAGISIWQEDWSAVGEAVRNLRRMGVEDIPAWYAAHPEEARALHARVMITGVNRSSVTIMRAQDADQLTGSLAHVLPGSIATFGRWLGAITRGSGVYVGESTIRRYDGEPFDCLVTAALPTDAAELETVIVSIIEITAYKRDQARLAKMQDEMARAQRIATVGALTASIAHEVNSPLAAASTNAAACLRWLDREEPDVPEAIDAAKAVLVDAQRAKAVIERTRTYLEKSERRRDRVEVRELLRDSARLVQREADSHGISMGLDLPSDLGLLDCDEVQLQQALVNLMVNAIQAMAGQPCPRLLKMSARRSRSGIEIAIEDTGPGIPSESIKSVFEPFYSTKEGGMGMGLAICRTAVEAHGGVLQVESSAPTGTRFVVRLPGSGSH